MTSLDSLRQMLAAITGGGKWIARPAKAGADEDEFSHYIYCDSYGVVGYWRGHKRDHTDHNWLLTEADAALIAIAPQAIAELIERCERAEALERKWRMNAGDPSIDREWRQMYGEVADELEAARIQPEAK